MRKEKLIIPDLTPVTTICYGQKRKWKSRVDAIEYFKCGIIESDGSERDRYVNVLIDLELMKDICTDKEDF